MIVVRVPLILATIVLLFAVVAACSSGDGADEADTEAGAAAATAPDESGPYTLTQVPEANIELTSTKFNTIRRIPVEYTCTKESKYKTRTGTTTHGQEWSPPLAWDSVPEGTKSIAIIMDDPDVSIEFEDRTEPWVHWVIWGLPPDVTELAEQVPTTTEVLSLGPSVRQGVNSYGTIGYSGPCPVAPKTGEVKDIWGQVSHATAPHEYSFKIYALDIEVDLAAGSSKNDLLRAMDRHILGIGEIKGEYVPQHKGL